jgi:hypothetical protein
MKSNQIIVVDTHNIRGINYLSRKVRQLLNHPKQIIRAEFCDGICMFFDGETYNLLNFDSKSCQTLRFDTISTYMQHKLDPHWFSIHILAANQASISSVLIVEENARAKRTCKLNRLGWVQEGEP